MTVAAEAAGTHTETIGGASVPNVITTMTDLSSWRLGSLNPVTTKTEATGGQMIAGIVETASIEVTATRSKSGESRVLMHKTSAHSMTRWMTIADSTYTKGGQKIALQSLVEEL